MATSTVAPEDSPATVEPQVTRELATEDTTTFWVYLDAQPDLAPAARITGRSDQGAYVYDELTTTASTSQADLVALLDEAGADYEQYWIANTVRVTGDDDLLDDIAALPEVAEITADRVYALPEPTPAAAESATDGVEWGIEAIGATDVWDTFGVTGEDIVVGSIDTGVQFDHPALASHYRGYNSDGTVSHDYNWWDPKGTCGKPSTPCDDHGHGTHTTGTMVGDDGTNHIGVAPGARWIAAKGCGVGGCAQSALLSAGQFMLAPTDLNGNNPNPDLRPHIVNNSWGGGPVVDPWYDATIDAWVAAGIFPAFSNGNDGPTCSTAGNPGHSAAAYATGAFDIDGAIADFSSRGPAVGTGEVKPDIAAPGVAIRSALPGNSFGAWDGTSMASPHVAGAVALLWSAAPTLARDIDSTRALLDSTAIDVENLTCGGTAADNNVWGEGRLDVFAAVQAAPRRATGTLTGTVTGAGAPIGGARVTITGVVDRERVSAGDGSYELTLPTGDYTVTVSAFGYESQTSDVVIAEDAVTVHDPVLGAPAGPRLAVSADHLDVGTTPVGTTSDPASLTLTGVGADPVTVTEISDPLDGVTLTGGTCGDVPFTLDRFQTCTLDYTLRTLRTGGTATFIRITSDAPDSPHRFTVGGTAVTLPARVDALSLDPGENLLAAAVIDPAGAFAYLPTASGDGQIVKVDLATLRKVGSIGLEEGEHAIKSAVMDPDGTYAYFGTSTAPGRIVKVDLDTFERVDAITLDAGENGLESAFMDPAGEFAYFTTATSPGRIIKIDLDTFERVDSLVLADGENSARAAAVAPDGRYGYVGTFTRPATLVKVDLATFERVGSISMDDEENFLVSTVIDPEGRYLYGGTATNPGHVVKVDLDTFERVDGLTLNTGENSLYSAVIDPAGRTAYFGGFTFPGRAMAIDLATFSPVGSAPFDTGENFATAALMDPAGRFAYFGTTTSPGTLVRVQIDTDFAAGGTPYRVRGTHGVDLTWDGSLTAETDIVRDGTVVATVANTGSYTDTIRITGVPRYTYRLCDAGTTRCSEDVPVRFDASPGHHGAEADTAEAR